MDKRLIVTSLITGSLLCSAGVAAQSLADVARAEEARRKAQKAPVKVYTNGDLGKGRDAAGTPPPPAAETSTTKHGAPGPSAAAKPSVSKPSEQPDTTGKDEKYWRTRISDARTAVQRSQAFHDALQSQINGLYAQFVATDDPAQRAVVEQKRLAALAELERVKAEIAKNTKAVADIEDEARRASVPPGWLR
jgi:hypothetical protein